MKCNPKYPNWKSKKRFGFNIETKDNGIVTAVILKCHLMTK